MDGKRLAAPFEVLKEALERHIRLRQEMAAETHEVMERLERELDELRFVVRDFHTIIRGTQRELRREVRTLVREALGARKRTRR